MLESIVKLQSKYINSKSEEERKKHGQFYTGSIVSDYMASLVSITNCKNIRIIIKLFV